VDTYVKSGMFVGLGSGHASGMAIQHLGRQLRTVGLNLNSSENLHKTFGSPWSDEPAKGDPEFNAYCLLHDAAWLPFKVSGGNIVLHILQGLFPNYVRIVAIWEQLMFIRVPNMEPLVRTNTYERGSYLCFDPNTFETVRKDNFVLHYEMLEKRPPLPQHR
ncbi:hypothetical protein S83_023417, partial [Arachis hypogaea]